MKITIRDVALTSMTIGMFGSTIYLYDNNKPVLDYMEYLPVYRVEQLWERQELSEPTTDLQSPEQIKPIE